MSSLRAAAVSCSALLAVLPAIGCDGVAGGGADARTSVDGAATDARPADPADAALPDADADPLDADLDADAATDAAADARNAGDGRSYPTDRAVFFGAPRCGRAGVLLCDDFESEAPGAAPDPAVWTVERAADTSSLVIDATRAARGQRSVHIHLTNGAASRRAVITERRTFPALRATLFGRMFVYLDAVPKPFVPSDTAHFPYVHWTAAQVSGPATVNGLTGRPNLRPLGGSNLQLIVNEDQIPQNSAMHWEVGIKDRNFPVGQQNLPARQWVCFEFEVTGSGTSPEVRVWWDGVEHPGLHLAPSNMGDLTGGKYWAMPTMDRLSLGWVVYQDYAAALPSFDVWIDEVAVDSQRIGCGI